MIRRLYYAEFSSAPSISVVAPRLGEQDENILRYSTELINDLVVPETRVGWQLIAQRMRGHQGIHAKSLAGMELPLALRKYVNPTVPLLNATATHVQAADDRIIEGLWPARLVG